MNIIYTYNYLHHIIYETYDAFYVTQKNIIQIFHAVLERNG